ncbi:DUF4357 domain-containing protein [Helcococcus massiliensis]|uniref:DUF4357 domain-containing protein n=1 Tax=Helcococcus massiliensis TaxID=2040290 RepID=UPI000CDEDF97|nr:DUF4357 domain-containing protein [Helcococcus massiliensis]
MHLQNCTNKTKHLKFIYYIIFKDLLNISNTELYALNEDLVVSLLSSFEGTIIYPKEKTKEEIFDDSSKELESKSDLKFIPNGRYYLNRNVKGFGRVKGEAVVEDGIIKVLKGSKCAPTKDGYVPEIRKKARIENDILIEDIICSSPSTAGLLVIGRFNNGWTEWKDKNGKKLAVFRDESNV